MKGFLIQCAVGIVVVVASSLIMDEINRRRSR
jgi:hypothetical protein